MKVLAFIGETGTGKSTLAAHLADRGAVVIDGDEIAHDLLENDPGVREKIAVQFGEEVFTSGGAVDRRKLGGIVFHDPDALVRLNGILHPVILDRMSGRLRECRDRGEKLAVIDAALLLDVDLPFAIDLVVALRCRRSEQVRRLRRMGLEEDAIGERLDNQRHLEKSFHKADIIVDTCKEIDILTAEIDTIVHGLLGMAL